MGRGELQRHKQPTDIEPSRSSFGTLSGSQLFVFGSLGIVALATIAVVAAVVALSVAVVVVALKPYFRK